MGGGRGYGPTHSQSLEKHFFGIPGLLVLALNHYVDPIDVYEPLVSNGHGASLVIENKIMYGGYFNQFLPAGFTFNRSDSIFPDILVKPDSNKVDVTFICYGGMGDILVKAADKLFEEHDIISQVLILTQLYPLNVIPYLKSLNEIGALIVVEEGQGFSGFGSEILSQIYENEFNIPKVRRIFAEPTCIPSSAILENEVLPNIEKIINCAISLMREAS